MRPIYFYQLLTALFKSESSGKYPVEQIGFDGWSKV